ncbi:MAG: PAC2 family protein [Candidatus Bathyarchaeota archaeon]|nr:PAC2 family protein [Candidatus Bathyarchaeota archaeon]
MNVTIHLTKEVPPKGSILICGLPGIAFIGKLSVDYLIRELGAKLVGEVHSRFFSPYVLIGKDGVVELLRNELYYLRDETGRGIFFFTGNAQAASPEGQYSLVDEVLDAVIQLGVRHVYSIAAFVTEKPFERPQVYGIATKPSLVDGMTEWGVLPMDQGSISGMNGLILGRARMKKLDGTCLLGETHGYQTPTGQFIVDAKAARAVLDVLTAMLGLSVDMKPLEKQAEQMDELTTRMAEVEKQVREELQRAANRDPSRYIT